MTSGPGTLRRLGLNLVLAVVALVAALALAEGLLALAGVGDSANDSWRTQGLQQPDEQLIYSMRPSSRRIWKTEEFVERTSVNALGLRGAEISSDEENRFRILVLGDSMTYGHGVGNVETYPHQLRRIISERQPELGIEVINAGTRGYGTDHSYKLFATRLRSLRPKIVVFALNYNDVGDDINYPLYDLDDGELIALDATESPLYKVALWSDRVPDWLADYRITRLAVRSGVALATLGYSTQPPDEGAAQWAHEKILVQLRSMAQMGADDGFHLLVLGLPMPETKWLPFEWLAEPIGGIAPFLDLSLDPSWRAEKERWFFRLNGHLSVAGNVRAAEALYEELAEPGWLDPDLDTQDE